MSVSEQAAWVRGEGQACVLIGNWINFSSSGGWQRIKQGLEVGPQAGLRERSYPSVYETCGREMVGDRVGQRVSPRAPMPRACSHGLQMTPFSPESSVVPIKPFHPQTHWQGSIRVHPTPNLQLSGRFKQRLV